MYSTQLSNSIVKSKVGENIKIENCGVHRTGNSWQSSPLEYPCNLPKTPAMFHFICLYTTLNHSSKENRRIRTDKRINPFACKSARFLRLYCARGIKWQNTHYLRYVL